MNLVTIGRPEHIDLAVPPLTPGKPSGRDMRQIADGYSEWVTKDWARAVNVEYRSGASGPSVSLIAEGGTIWTEGDPKWPVLLMARAGPVIKIAPSTAELVQARWAFSAGPWLIRDGQRCNLTAEIAAGEFTGLSPGLPRERAGVGIRADGALVHVADMSLTLDQLTDRLTSYGCHDAIGLDGGGSVCVLDATGKVLLGQATRQVCCALVFRKLVEEPVQQAQTLPTVALDFDFGRNITPNFTLSEFACKHCGAVSLSPKFGELVARLQMLRSKVGKPVYVTSGYRCAKHDKAVGTSSEPGAGPHTTGTAADIYVSGMSVDALAQAARAVGFTGIGKYRSQGFVHVDLRQPAGEWEA